MAGAELAQQMGGPGGPHLRALYRGITIDYWPDTYRGQVRGSLQSFAYGHNAGSFPPAAVGLACRELARAIGVPPELMLLQRLEVGLNLALPTSPRPLLAGLTHHKGSPFLAMIPPARTPRPLEFVAFHTDYRIKIYDKGTYARLKNLAQMRWLPLLGLSLNPSGQPAPANKPVFATLASGQQSPDLRLKPASKSTQHHLPTLPDHLLRLEAVFLRARALRLRGLPAPLTLAHLPEPATLAIFAQHLRRLWGQVHHQAPMSFPLHTTTYNAALLVAGADSTFWPATRLSAAPATYKRTRAKYPKLREAQTKHTGPHPLTPLLDEALRPWLTL